MSGACGRLRLAWRRGLAVLAALLPWAVAATGALAQPGDIGAGWEPVETPTTPDLPEPPDDHVTEVRGEVTWTFPAAATSDVRDLMDGLDEHWSRIEDDLGQDLDDELVLRVGRNPDQMAALAPEGHPPPRYASGVAYPRFGVILLTLTAPDSWERPPMENVFVHELSHIALYRAVGGHPVPRWFSEGMAIHHSGELSLERTKTLWSATVAGNLEPLSDLSRGFPSRSHRVNVAYAQSADFVSFLRGEEGRGQQIRELIDELRAGRDFDDAVSTAWGRPLSSLESEWRESLDQRFHAIPLIVTGGGLWVLLSLFIVFAYVRKKRRDRRRLDEMEREEQEEDEALARAEAVLADKLARAEEEDDEPEERLVVDDDPPQGREPGVPTVEYEGRSHTLH